MTYHSLSCRCQKKQKVHEHILLENHDFHNCFMSCTSEVLYFFLTQCIRLENSCAEWIKRQWCKHQFTKILIKGMWIERTILFAKRYLIRRIKNEINFWVKSLWSNCKEQEILTLTMIRLSSITTPPFVFQQ